MTQKASYAQDKDRKKLEDTALAAYNKMRDPPPLQSVTPPPPRNDTNDAVTQPRGGGGEGGHGAGMPLDMSSGRAGGRSQPQASAAATSRWSLADDPDPVEAVDQVSVSTPSSLQTPSSLPPLSLLSPSSA
jgi:hypothetical protein